MCNSRKNPSEFQVSFWSGSRRKRRFQSVNYHADIHVDNRVDLYCFERLEKHFLRKN